MPAIVTIIHDRFGETLAHKAGCAHLNRANLRHEHGYDITADTRDDVIFEAWGASGVATDDFGVAEADADPAGYRAYTLERYADQVQFAPCLKVLK